MFLTRSAEYKDQEKLIDGFLAELDKHKGGRNVQHDSDGTIKNFTTVKTACKLELSIIGNKAYLERITGDVQSVIGWKESDLIGRDLISLMGVDVNLINKTLSELNRNNFSYKENMFYAKNGELMHTQSILMWRERGKKIVEFVWQK